jgi:hypothetical protein
MTLSASSVKERFKSRVFTSSPRRTPRPSRPLEYRGSCNAFCAFASFTKRLDRIVDKTRTLGRHLPMCGNTALAREALDEGRTAMFRVLALLKQWSQQAGV